MLFQEVVISFCTGQNNLFVSEKVKVLWKGFSPLSSFDLEILIKQADHSQ